MVAKVMVTKVMVTKVVMTRPAPLDAFEHG